MAKEITEESGIHEEWYREANDMTIEKLPEFMRKLTQDYTHDYGTICHAVASAALAAAHTINHDPNQGGITGFQASCIMWEFISKWMSCDGKPMRLLDYEKMLYPQYEKTFRSISKSTAEWLQEKAKEILGGGDFLHEEVREHLEAVANGWIPFDYRVVD